jgi:hypothetical protein
MSVRRETWMMTMVWHSSDAEPLGDVVDVHVHADLGAVLVVGLEEGALADDDLRLAHVLAHQVRAGLVSPRYAISGISSVARDLDAAVLEFLELLLRQVRELWLELGALLDDEYPSRGGVLGVEARRLDVVLDLELPSGSMGMIS